MRLPPIFWYAAYQLNLWPCVSLPETLPILRWTGEVGDASVFQVWGSRAFVRDNSADKLSSRAIPCVFLGFPPDARGWQFYHPTLRRVLLSQDNGLTSRFPFYRLFAYRTAPLTPPPLVCAPGPPPVDPLSPQDPAPSGVSQVDHVELVEVAVDSGVAGGGVARGVAPGGAEPERLEPKVVETRVAESGGAEPGGTVSARGPTLPRQDGSRSLYCRCVSGLLGAPAFGVALPELRALPLETLLLEALGLEALELSPLVVLLLMEVLEVLELLVLALLEVLKVLEVLELVVLLALELETLGME
ncbi:unnamed protein product [Closterium sp. NIES-65]|nr:unnamed protein product [Closterium sp. NIES-65]